MNSKEKIAAAAAELVRCELAFQNAIGAAHQALAELLRVAEATDREAVRQQVSDAMDDSPDGATGDVPAGRGGEGEPGRPVTPEKKREAYWEGAKK